MAASSRPSTRVFLTQRDAERDVRAMSMTPVERATRSQHFTKDHRVLTLRKCRWAKRVLHCASASDVRTVS